MRYLALSVILAAGSLSAASPRSASPSNRGEALIEVNAGRKAGYKIPRTIYGTFLEPIGKSIYGGLWAQILENPSFEDGLWSASYLGREVERKPELERASYQGLPFPWEPLDHDQGRRYEPSWTESANSSRSVLIMALPGKQTGIRQEVYLPAHRTLRYRGSLYARRQQGPRDVEISLRRRNHAENILSRAVIRLAGVGWSRYEFSLDLKPGQLARLEPADFVIAVSDEARVFVDQVLLFPADQVDGMDPEMVELARALKTPVVRFGGNFVSGYHWRDGIGPMDKRVSMLNQAWGIPEYNQFGTDEFLRFCERIGAEPQIALNLGSGTPQEAAAWVRYVNERWGDRRGGLLWELGNELWGAFQIGYPTLERAAGRTVEFSRAVRGVDPAARMIATGAEPDHFREWNTEQLKLPSGTFQFLSTHFVVGTASVRRSNPSPDFVTRSAFALPVGLEQRLREMKAQIDGDPQARDRAQIAFTEWLFHGPDDRVPRFTNMGGAVITAGFLNTLMRVADFTPVADMTGLIEFGGIWKKRGQVYAVPAYWAFRMYSTAEATTPVEARATAGTYDVAEGNRRIPEIQGVAYLDVVAALNDAGDKLTLFCVNRHLNLDLTTGIRLTGFQPSGRARVQTLAGTGIYQVNDEVRPEAVLPVESVLETAGPEIRHIFPRASVTVIELKGRHAGTTGP